MGKVNSKFVTILFLFFFVFPVFSAKDGIEGRKIDSGGRAGSFCHGAVSSLREPSKKGTSSGSGSDRRASVFSGFQNDEIEIPKIDSYNPSTGWHTVSESNEVVNYRGARKAVPDEELEVSCVTAEKLWNRTTIVEICFNQEINPRSFSSANLKINGKTVNNDVKFKFSRKGDSVKIQIPAQEEKFSLSLGDVEAFDGEKIPEIKLNDISVN